MYACEQNKKRDYFTSSHGQTGKTGKKRLSTFNGYLRRQMQSHRCLSFA